jgi:hypothetical protein
MDSIHAEGIATSALKAFLQMTCFMEIPDAHVTEDECILFVSIIGTHWTLEESRHIVYV